MYGNLHYIKKTSSIIYSHYDNGNKGIEEGKKQIVKEHFVPSFYIVDEKSTGKYKTGEGEPLTEIICDTWKKRQSKIDYYKSSGRKIYGSDYKTENLFISQKLHMEGNNLRPEAVPEKTLEYCGNSMRKWEAL